jgi:broad specificity phosphatase PhoE
MKTVYFLRHGQTALNRSFVHQYPDTPLSAEGRAQARAAATRLKDVPFDVIIASPLARTRETADIVAAVKSMPVEESDLFVELRRPRELWGKSWFAPRSLWIMGQLYLNASKDHWHYADEENLEEFHARARRALEYLANRPDERILVVSHRGFMVTLMELIAHDGLDSVAQYRRALWKNFTIKNCGIVRAAWTPEGENGETLRGTWSVCG